MAVVKQGGGDPFGGQSLTSRGYIQKETRLCYVCGKQKLGGLFTVNANGKPMCPDCAGSKHQGALTGFHDREPEDGDLDDAVLPDD